MGLYEKNNLRLTDPIYYGNRCGRTGLRLQYIHRDVIEADKPQPSGTNPVAPT